MTQRRKPRKYTDEFREEAVKLVTEQGYSVTEAANSLGITTKLLYNWKDKFIFLAAVRQLIFSINKTNYFALSVSR
ncbi:transposase [Litorilituus sediminis]|uniref:Transposase n=1 Tax=Litorilituus sediminis TaxID=718192 RepID=A0A4P6P5Q1_9GAMM|nr:transposase [Litorilituus sediminis]